MPALATYSPLETLLFIQSVAINGANTPTFRTISTSLNANKLIQDDEAYSSNKLTPEALGELYSHLISTERERKSDGRPNVNGHTTSNSTTSRKRKLSASPSPPTRVVFKDDQLVALLVDRLYAEFKAQTIQEIKQEEEEYRQLRQEANAVEINNVGERASIADGSSIHNGHRPVMENAYQKQDPVLAPPLDLQLDAGPVDARTPKDREGVSIISSGECVKSSDIQRTSINELIITHPADEVQRSSISHSRPTSRALGNQPLPHIIPPAYSQGPLPLPPGGSALASLPPPVPNSQHARYAAPPPQKTLRNAPAPHSPVILPPPPGMSPMQPPMTIPTAHRKSSSAARGSPLPPPSPQQYQQYPPYNYSQTPWPTQAFTPQPYPQHHSPYASSQFYPSSPGGGMNPPPFPYPLYPQYLQSAPHHSFPHGPLPPPIPGSNVTPHSGYSGSIVSGSVSSTPTLRLKSRRPRRGPTGSFTPWTPSDKSSRLRHTTPEPLKRDFSPISDQGSPTPDTREHVDNKSSQSKSQESTTKSAKSAVSHDSKTPALKQVRNGRFNGRTRGRSTASPVTMWQSRSQSVASFSSETRPERSTGQRLQQVEHEPPSTPAPTPMDAEQRSSGRRRTRGINFHSQPESVVRTQVKRKHDSAFDSPISPTVPTAGVASLQTHPRGEPSDPNFVVVTKNFARLAGPVLNDAIAHKLAGIFAKPLTEREAPGYKDLVYRPQDLKSIKAAVNRGSRAANAAIDEAGNAGEDGTGTPGKNSITLGTMSLKKREELVPPKGIVNSSQLEMEFMRMFANAIMFNPLPRSARGFGPLINMVRAGTETVQIEEQTDEGEGDPEVKGYGYAIVEEGGIIEDTREMCESVEKAVADWRRVGQGHAARLPDDGFRSSGLVGLRGGSVSSALAAEDSAEEDESVVTGTTRQKRKLAIDV